MAALPQQIALPSQTAAYDLAFQICPIILAGGIAASAQGKLLPITALMGLPSTGNDPNMAPPDPNRYPRFLPMPGSTLISQAVGTYPFANQQVAANATIQQPLTLSLVMIAPVNQPGGYLSKLPMFTGLRNALEQHNNAGGLYNVATPAYVYNGLIMTAMTDLTSEENRQKQIEWQIDFVQPLVTQAQAQAAQSALMQKITSGGQFTSAPAWSGTQAAAPSNLAGVTAALQQFGSAAPSSGTLSGNPTGNTPAGTGIG